MNSDNLQKIKREEEKRSYLLTKEGREMLSFFIKMEKSEEFQEFERWLIKRDNRIFNNRVITRS